MTETIRNGSAQTAAAPMRGKRRATWRATWEGKGKPPRPARSESGFPLEVAYGPEDLEGWDSERDLAWPGEYPYTRGVHPTMHRGSLWTMRQYAGFGTAEDTNQRFKYLLDQGVTGLSMAFDLPTQIGLDALGSEFAAEVGRIGVAISTLQDMADVFDGIPLDQVSTNFTINGTSAHILAMYIAVGEQQGVPAAALRGTLQNDILKEYIARGTWTFPAEPSMRLTADVIEYCSRQVPRFNPISISAAHIRQAGASPVEAVGFTLANAIEYINAVLARGLPIDAFAPRLSFNLGLTTNDFFEEIAKFRATRRLWARLLRETYGAQDPNSWKFRFYAGCGGMTLTREEPLNNIVRVAYQAMSSALGGAQAIHTASYDEAYAIPTEESVRVALRTQQILAYETGIANTVDPLAGSYYVEWLTNQFEAAVQQVMAEVAAQGGMLRAIESGYVQRRMAQTAYEQERRIQTGEQVVVGVNKFQGGPKAPIQIFQPDPATLRRQAERVARVKARRDGAAVGAALGRLTGACQGRDNLMPYVVAAVKAEATVGEITDAMKTVFGEYVEPGIL